jgi:type II secretory pathway component PulK
MQKQLIEITQGKCRKNERGAALITVVMISFLLLVVVAALLLETSMNAANVTDATAEEQAYYAAESGIQTVLNVLRGNTIPNPLIDSSKPQAIPPIRLITLKLSGSLLPMFRATHPSNRVCRGG